MHRDVYGKCLRCGEPRPEHGRHLTCKDGRHYKYTHRVSASFTIDEVELIHQLLSTLQRGGDLRILARNKGLPRAARTISRMRARAQEQIRQAKREAS